MTWYEQFDNSIAAGFLRDTPQNFGNLTEILTFSPPLGGGLSQFRNSIRSPVTRDINHILISIEGCVTRDKRIERNCTVFRLSSSLLRSFRHLLREQPCKHIQRLTGRSCFGMADVHHRTESAPSLHTAGRPRRQADAIRPHRRQHHTARRNAAPALHLCCTMARSLCAQADSTSACAGSLPSSSAHQCLPTQRCFTPARRLHHPPTHIPSSRPPMPSAPPFPRPRTPSSRATSPP